MCPHCGIVGIGDEWNIHYCAPERIREMIAKQERLGAELEKLLHDNAWKLYAR